MDDAERRRLEATARLHAALAERWLAEDLHAARTLASNTDSARTIVDTPYHQLQDCATQGIGIGMTAHAAHPDAPVAAVLADEPGQAPDFEGRPILFDDCPRCAEHADAPLTTLDRHATAALWRRMVAVEKWVRGTVEPRYLSTTEARAGHRMYEVAVFLERCGLDPWRWPPRSWPPTHDEDEPVRWAGV